MNRKQNTGSKYPPYILKNSWTLAVILSFHLNWMQVLVKSLLTGIAYVDLREAFDIVNPSVLLRKLSWIGIENTEWLWFENYFTSRYQRVNHAGIKSDVLPISHCVPPEVYWGHFFLYFLLMIYLIIYQNVKLASMQMTQLLNVLEELLRKFRYHSNTRT